jgi:uncharacterized protein (TIGR02145 family)
MITRTVLVVGSVLLMGVISSAQEPRTFTDPRDGRTYKIVTIGTQIWMAENLAYKTGDWYAYGWDSDNRKANAAKYGLLYEWKTAKKACPPGAHLPTKDEWETLIDVVGGKNIAGTLTGGQYIAGERMKDPAGWGEGTNSHGFSALPGGYRTDFKTFDQRGEGAHWWTATEDNEYVAWTWAVHRVSKHGSFGTYGKSAGGALSVRCLIDRFPPAGPVRGGCASCAQ